MVHHLRLEMIPEIGPPFSKALLHLHGNRLDYIDCEATNDKHLYHITSQSDRMCRVYIIHCPDITVEGLKEMISTRRRRVLDREGFTYDYEVEVTHHLRDHRGMNPFIQQRNRETVVLGIILLPWRTTVIPRV